MIGSIKQIIQPGKENLSEQKTVFVIQKSLK